MTRQGRLKTRQVGRVHGVFRRRWPAPVAAGLLAAGLFCPSLPVHACADIGCAPAWTLGGGGSIECDNKLFLTPSNDTRVNLLLLLADQRGRSKSGLHAAGRAEPQVAWETFLEAILPSPVGEGNENNWEYRGSRCASDASGKAAFVAALRDANLPSEERDALIRVRKGFVPECDKGVADTSLNLDRTISSAVGQAYLAYLQGAVAFYNGDFSRAAARFASVRARDQKWLTEAARYMDARVALNAAIVTALNEWGYFEGLDAVNRTALNKAATAFSAYLSSYPQGRYAASARGLQRRVYWLGQDGPRLAQSYTPLIMRNQDVAADVELVEEIDLKLLPGLTLTGSGADPMVLLVSDLVAMRAAIARRDEAGIADGGGFISRNVIEGQRAAFGKRTDLHDFALASYALHVDRQPREALRLLPKLGRKSFTALSFSQQILRGQALDMANDPGARAHWLAMLDFVADPYQRVTVELAIARYDERHQGLARVFAADSKVQDPIIRAILLAHVAGPDVLRTQAQKASVPRREQEIATYTLLYKNLTHGFYADFVRDLALVPKGASAEATTFYIESEMAVPVGIFTVGPKRTGFACPALRATAASLASNPRAARPLLCLGEFMRLNDVDPSTFVLPAPDDNLGSTPSLFPGKFRPRSDLYKQVIADRAAPAEDRAYALYRAVYCYAPSGYNSCGGNDAPLSQRRAWFVTLKRDYPNSPWARDLRYYW